MSLSESNMKIMRVEEHPTDLATDKVARPAALVEAPYFGLMDSPGAASRPRNHHRPTTMALPAALEPDADIGDGRIKHLDEQGIQMQVVSYGSLAPLASVGQAVGFTSDTLDGPHNLPASQGRKELP
jgi:uncharacterized protein